MLASRQMLRDFYAEFAATQMPKAVLRSLWDALSPNDRQRDSRQEARWRQRSTGKKAFVTFENTVSQRNVVETLLTAFCLRDVKA